MAATLFAVLPPSARAELIEGLDETVTRLEARAHPFAEDFSDGPIGAELLAWLAARGPVLTAVSALCAKRWASHDGRFQVQVSSRCSAAEPGLVVPLWTGAPTASAAERRARFFAWPYAASILVKPEDQSPAHTAALREQSFMAGSPIGAVISASALSDDVARDLNRAHALARRALRLLRRHGVSVDDSVQTALEALAQAPREHTPCGAALAPEGHLLVVPRLSALGRLDEFRTEVAKTRPQLPAGGGTR